MARNFPAELKEATRAEVKAKVGTGVSTTFTTEAEETRGGGGGGGQDHLESHHRTSKRSRRSAGGDNVNDHDDGGGEQDVAAKDENGNDNHDADYDDDDGADNEDNYPSLPDGEDLDALVDQLEVPSDEDDGHAQEKDGEQKGVAGPVVQPQSEHAATAEPETDSQGSRDSRDTQGINTAGAVGSDRLTGFRLSARNIEQKDLDERLASHKFFDLKDTEGIREVGHRLHNLGLLPSTRPGGRLDLSLSSSSSSSRGTATTGGATSARGAGGDEGTANKAEALPDWVVAGVVSAKSKPRTTAKHVRYCHFQLSDLRNHEVNVFMFREVMDRHYSQLRVGQVVALLSPKLLAQTDRLCTLGVQVEKTDNLVVIGMGHDIGFCEAVKLNGSDCGKAIDRRTGHYCTFHVQLAANKLRSKRGALLASTSSTFDLNQSEQLRMQQILKGGGGGSGGDGGYFQQQTRLGIRKPGEVDQGQSAMQQARRIRNMDGRDTNYIFDDGALGSSSMTEPTTPGKRKRQNDGDDPLTAFLMNQDNPGGMYLRQAMASKDVTWVKDITSPKTPTKGDPVLFPPDMVRRMGYDPVTGRFVPGSPKRREHDDPEARERSIRMLTDRIKSPPARPILMTGSGSGQGAKKGGGSSHRGKRLVVGDVFFSEKEKEEGPNKSGRTTPVQQRWINLDDASDDGDNDNDDDDDNRLIEGPDGSPVLSFSAQRRKNLREAARAGGEPFGLVNGVSATGSIELRQRSEIAFYDDE
ncbi:hypothetical protein DFQ26_009842 [Actinomortierella ambigua]|nr:hypothetical protein DFQ26_009842 [Actinomortierella ambigua]